MAFCLQNTTKLLDRSIKVRRHGSTNTNKAANANLNHTQSFTTFLLATRPSFLFTCSYQIVLDSDTIKGVGIISLILARAIRGLISAQWRLGRKKRLQQKSPVSDTGLCV